MSNGAITDFAQYEQDQRAEILASGRSREQLLVEIRDRLRELRLALPTYKRLQDPARYSFAVEDIDEYETTYKQLANDSAGVFEHDDYVELLALVRTRMVVMTAALQRIAEGKAPRAAASTRRVSGCMVLLVVFFVVWIVGMVIR